MSKIITTQDFIKRAKTRHGDKYNYDKVVYVGYNKNVVINCPEHGDFEQTPATHQSGGGCKMCYNNRRGESQRLTKEKFIHNSKLKHGDKYNYDNVIYINHYTKVSIYCNIHGYFEISPNAHTNGQGCKDCGNISKSDMFSSNTQEFINKSIGIHGDKFDYSLVEYKNAKTKVKIICDKGHIFEQTPNSHLNGKKCNKCYIRRKTSTEELIEKFKSVHGDRYDYSNVKYVDSKNKVKIFCKLDGHGIFEQNAYNHMNSQGCPKCGGISTGIRLSKKPHSWSITQWEKKAKESKYFDSFKVYIIKCLNNDEEFYKIGRTFLKTKKRFMGFKYKYEIIKEIVFETAKEAFDKETELKRLNKEYKYLPKIKFAGRYECFSEIIKEIIFYS